MLVIGIGYCHNRTVGTANRFRDMTPCRDEEVEREMSQVLGVSVSTGGAASLLKFIESELGPHIEARYSTIDTSKRTLLGHSLGGLFGWYALLNSNFFVNGIFGSPALDWANRWMFEQKLPEQRSGKVFQSVGELELESNQANVLAWRQYIERTRKLHVTTKFIEGETHLSVPPVATSKGLRCIFE